MRTDLFDFDLPPDRIALRPASPRDSARLLVVRPGHNPLLEDRIVRDLPDLLLPGDQLVVNDTKVIPAQLSGRRIGGAKRPPAAATPDQPAVGPALEARGQPPPPATARRSARVVAGGRGGGGERRGYQTRWGGGGGGGAAATAGLHFTERLVGELTTRGISFHTVTLHVGAGTFLPVKVDDVAGHKMHAESGQVTREVANALNAARLGARASRPPFPGTAGGSPASSLPNSGRAARAPRIVAVGSTSLRLLESATRDDGVIAPFSGDTSLFITPGYRFRVVDVLLTNFHLPRSTLFMLVAAFCGLDTMKRAYAHAVAKGYRFYSYGDACLLFRNP